MVIKKGLYWVGTVVAAWQFLGCSKISEQSQTTANAIGTVAYQQAHRKVYQHSVIPGGVYSADELARARRTDPVVEEHYADFGNSGVHEVRLREDTLMYVSYRKADKVFWTRKKHLVCKGEAVLVDDKNNVARSRCGNRLSKTPKSPTGKNEPAQSALDIPQAPAGPSSTGAGPLEAENLPAASPFLGGFPNERPGIGDPGATSPVSTGAGREPLAPPAGTGQFPAPFFSAGPLVGPGLVTTTTGGGAGTTTPTSGGTTTGTGGTTTGTGTGTTPTGGGTTTGTGGTTTGTGGGTTTGTGGTTGTGSGGTTTGTGGGTTTGGATVAPEPASFWLIALASGCFYMLRLRKRN